MPDRRTIDGTPRGTLPDVSKIQNPKKHGGYSRYIDGRTKDGQWIRRTVVNWISDLGGVENLTSMELTILNDLALIAWRCLKLGGAIVQGNGNVTESVTKDFLRFHSALVDGLCKLGLKRRARQAEDLQTYLKRRALEQRAQSSEPDREPQS